MRPLLVFIAISIVALPLFAVDIDPAAPTSATPVTLTVHEFASCPPPPEVTRSGNTFNVLLKPGPCLSPPTNVTFMVPLAKLAPGDYEVVVVTPYFDGLRRTDYGAFFVRDADAQFSVQSQSVGPTTGGTKVVLNALDTIECFGPDLVQCPPPKVLFNGVEAQVDIDQFMHNQLVVTTPPGPKGVADVVVIGKRATKSGRVFRYYDPSEGPLPSMFERVLVPVWFSGPGAFGSNWTTEVTLLNPSFFDFEPYRRAPLPLVAHGRTTALSFGASRTGGALFFAPREVSPATRFGSRVRDTSREGDDWGTEVRVARESDFRTADFSLLDIPVDARFRQTLRIYDPDSVESLVEVRAYAMDGTFLAGRNVRLQSANPCPAFQPCASDDPAAATLDLLAFFPEAAGQQRVSVDIRPLEGQRLWALATVTNNQTQHVTVITPQ